MEDYCVCCGRYVPEGRMICPTCERITMVRSSGSTTSILEFLKKYHTGSRNAVPSKELEQRFSVDGRTIRRKIHALRREGYPICSGNSGYYYAENQRDIDGTVGRLNGLVTGVSNAQAGLLFSTVLDPSIHIEISVRMGGGKT